MQHAGSADSVSVNNRTPAASHRHRRPLHRQRRHIPGHDWFGHGIGNSGADSAVNSFTLFAVNRTRRRLRCPYPHQTLMSAAPRPRAEPSIHAPPSTTVHRLLLHRRLQSSSSTSSASAAVVIEPHPLPVPPSVSPAVVSNRSGIAGVAHHLRRLLHTSSAPLHCRLTDTRPLDSITVHRFFTPLQQQQQ